MKCERRPIVAGNWGNGMENDQNCYNACELATNVGSKVRNFSDREVVVFPSLRWAAEVKEMLQGCDVKVGGQFTCDEIMQIIEKGVEYVLVGHSESRGLYQGKNSVSSQIKDALKAKLKPILCVGETESGSEIIGDICNQVTNSLKEVKIDRGEDLLIAYEPLLSRNRNEKEGPLVVQEIAKCIRGKILELYGSEVASSVNILYAGDITSKNVEGFMKQEDIDGVLVGRGESLDYEEFGKIVEAV